MNRKMMLVIDEPQTCSKCPVCKGYALDGYVCGATGEAELAYDEERGCPEYCPLRELNTGGWIPCSEKLPETNTYVLVTHQNGLIQISYLSDDGNFVVKDSGDLYAISVIAWQPLPEPYQSKVESADWQKQIMDRFMRQD